MTKSGQANDRSREDLFRHSLRPVSLVPTAECDVTLGPGRTAARRLFLRGAGTRIGGSWRLYLAFRIRPESVVSSVVVGQDFRVRRDARSRSRTAWRRLLLQDTARLGTAF